MKPILALILFVVLATPAEAAIFPVLHRAIAARRERPRVSSRRHPRALAYRLGWITYERTTGGL
jgi:hypothetical protein